MTSTPTPGDLSALSDWLLDKAAREPSAAEQHMLREAAAALSALPAAGGECTCPSGDWSLRWPCPRHPPTPQPSAADTHRWNIERDGDDLLICDGEHDKATGCNYVRYTLDAAVGAQGDGEGLTGKQAWWAGARAGLGLPADTPRTEVAAALAAARAAPAAGKGVDDAMACLMSSEGDWTVLDCPHCHRCVTYSRKAASSKEAYRDLTAKVANLEAALTRQPVAGDGK